MNKFLFILSCFLCLFYNCGCRDSSGYAENETISFDDIQEMNSLIKKILRHFKSPNATTMPLPIPDPFHRPDHVYPPPLMIKTTNVMIYGVSGLKVENLTSDLVSMKMNFDLHMPSLMETGSYQCTWSLINCSGIFSLSVKNARWHCNGELKITESGSLAVSKIELDLKHRDDMKIYIQDGGLIGHFLNNFGDVIFESMKSYILQVINKNAENFLNEQFKKLKIMLPNSIPPLDIFTFEARKLVKSSMYDPFRIPDYQYANNILLFEIKRTLVYGASTFYRTGNIKAILRNHTIQAIVNFGTDRIRGDSEWELGLLGVYTKFGKATFFVDYVNVAVNVTQPLDLTKKPKIADMNIQLGNLQLTMDTYGIVEYVLEFVVNLVVNWLRNQIVQLLGTQITSQVEEILSRVDLEEVISNQLSFTDEQLAWGSLMNPLHLKFKNH